MQVAGRLANVPLDEPTPLAICGCHDTPSGLLLSAVRIFPSVPTETLAGTVLKPCKSPFVVTVIAPVAPKQLSTFDGFRVHISPFFVYQIVLPATGGVPGVEMSVVVTGMFTAPV